MKKSYGTWTFRRAATWPEDCPREAWHLAERLFDAAFFFVELEIEVYVFESPLEKNRGCCELGCIVRPTMWPTLDLGAEARVRVQQVIADFTDVEGDWGAGGTGVEICPPKLRADTIPDRRQVSSDAWEGWTRAPSVLTQA